MATKKSKNGLTRYAILVGATDLLQGLQKSLVDFKDFLTNETGGAWRENEIMITGPLDWSLVQLLQARLREYDFVLVYRCRFSGARTAQDDYGEKLKSVAEERGIFISAVCDDIVDARELRYEATDKEVARA